MVVAVTPAFILNLLTSYAVVGTRLFQTRFGQWCADGQYRFYGKFL